MKVTDDYFIYLLTHILLGGKIIKVAEPDVYVIDKEAPDESPR